MPQVQEKAVSWSGNQEKGDQSGSATLYLGDFGQVT